MAVNADQLKESMRYWTTGVAIVCSRLGNEVHGMTVNSFTSISVVPALVTVTLAKTTRTHEMVSDSGVFSISILASDQAEISDRFAGKIAEDQDRFEGVDSISLASGVPAIAGGLAWLDCRVIQKYEMGSSTLFIGEVEEALTKGGSPLIYHNRRYAVLGD